MNALLLAKEKQIAYLKNQVKTLTYSLVGLSIFVLTWLGLFQVLHQM